MQVAQDAGQVVQTPVVLAVVPAGQVVTQEPLLKNLPEAQDRQLVARDPLQVAQAASHPQSPVVRSALPVGQVVHVVAEVQVAQVD